MRLEEMVLKLLVSFAAGGLVGMEREWKERPAGLRTHMLVAGGSALMTLVSSNFPGPHVDPTRIAAQIVTGIGFLGAGTIFRSGNTVRGLTTAAGLWTVAGIGMAIATGGTILYLGLLTAACVFVLNRWVGHWENTRSRRRSVIVVQIAGGKEVLPAVVEALRASEVSIQQLHWISQESSSGPAELELMVELKARVKLEEVAVKLGTLPLVRGVEWE